jgi:hypothetical protein
MEGGRQETHPKVKLMQRANEQVTECAILRTPDRFFSKLSNVGGSRRAMTSLQQTS